jgi:hypothetical protein
VTAVVDRGGGADTDVLRRPPAEAGRTPPRRPSRRARRLALVAAALAALAGVKLVSDGWFGHRGVAAYERLDYPAAERAFERMTLVNVVERWKAPFDVGVARAADDDLDGAEAAFRRSLGIDPTRCETRFNLAATVEAIGDDIPGGGRNPAVRQRYEDALAIATDGDCDPESDAGVRLAQLIDRLRQKLSRTAGTSENATSDGEGPPTDRTPEADPGQFPSGNQSSEIQQRNQAGAAERRDRQETITLAPGTRDRTRW